MAFRNIVSDSARIPEEIKSLQLQIAQHKSQQDYAAVAMCELNLAQQIRRCPRQLYVDPSHRVKHQVIALINALANIKKISARGELSQASSFLGSHIFIELNNIATSNKAELLEQTDEKILKCLKKYCNAFNETHPNANQIWDLIVAPNTISVTNTIRVTRAPLPESASVTPRHSHGMVQTLLHSPRTPVTVSLRPAAAPSSHPAAPKNHASGQPAATPAQSTFSTVLSNKWFHASLFAASAFVLAETSAVASAAIGVTTAATITLAQQCRRR